MQLAPALALALAAVALPLAAAQPADTCPLAFTATATGDGRVAFHWAGFGGADGYQVFGRQGEGDAAAYTAMLSGDARDGASGVLSPGTYTFWVTAYHSGTVVASSCERTVQVAPALAAACPASVAASYVPPATVHLAWSGVPGATGYRIARSADNGTLVDDYATAGPAATSYNDTGVAPGHAYSYRVIVQNTREPPEACSPAAASVPGASVPVLPGGAEWLAAAGGAGLCALLLRRR